MADDTLPKDSYSDSITKTEQVLGSIGRLSVALHECGLSCTPGNVLDDASRILKEYKAFLSAGQFKVGDWVTFKDSQKDKVKDTGWSGAAHMFVPGKLARVVGIRSRDGKRELSIVFDNPTRIAGVMDADPEGTEIPCSSGIYVGLSEDLFCHSVYHLASKAAYANKKEIEVSTFCGCFFCCDSYNAYTVSEFTTRDESALCPKCGVDAVIPDKSGLKVTNAKLLLDLHKFWFERRVKPNEEEKAWG